MKDIDRKRMMRTEKGSVTVEAALVLPMFICAVLSLAFFIKLVYIHELIQHAITQTADELASTSYIYYVTGVQGVHDELRDGIKDKAEASREHISVVFNFLSDLQGNQGDLPEIPDNPLEELKGLACILAEGVFDDGKTELCIPLVKLYMKKYLTGESKDADLRIRRLNIAGGMQGLDFSESNFFEDDNNDIDIVVRYEVQIPVPFKFLPRLAMVQRATSQAWLGGDEGWRQRAEDGQENGKGSVWSLNNFQRGNKIREQFGANLPKMFPVIASFDSGTATMIKSMDLTAKYYQSSGNVEEKLQGYIAELAKFKGGARDNKVITENQIKYRKLKLIIPENEIKPEVSEIIDRCVYSAAARGIELEVIRYQKKETKTEPKGEN